MSTDPDRTIADHRPEVNQNAPRVIPARHLIPRTTRANISGLRTVWDRSEPPPDPPPLTRADCVNGPRPCPHYLCRHHLLLETRAGDELQMLEGGVDTCALDVAERGPLVRDQPGADGPATLSEIGAILRTTRERVRQIEEHAISRLARHAGHGIVRQLADHLDISDERASKIAEDAKVKRLVKAKHASTWDSRKRRRGRPPISR